MSNFAGTSWLSKWTYSAWNSWNIACNRLELSRSNIVFTWMFMISFFGPSKMYCDIDPWICIIVVSFPAIHQIHPWVVVWLSFYCGDTKKYWFALNRAQMPHQTPSLVNSGLIIGASYSGICEGIFIGV